MGDGVGDFVVKAVARQRRVVRLDVQPILALEAVAGEEAVDGGAVEVVLVLRRLMRLGLDEQVWNSGTGWLRNSVTRTEVAGRVRLICRANVLTASPPPI